MKTVKLDMLVRFISLVLALVLLSSGCAALMAPKAERYVAPPMGATWTSARRDTGSFGSGTAQATSRRGERLWQGKSLIAFESPDMTTLALPSGHWVSQVRGDTPLVTWDPPIGWEWPLEVGKTWTKKHSVTIHARQQTLPFDVTTRVEAYESVTVPAGTFKTFKMISTDTLGNENVRWFSPELGLFVKSSLKRTAKHAAGPGTRDIELVSHTIAR